MSAEAAARVRRVLARYRASLPTMCAEIAEALGDDDQEADLRAVGKGWMGTSTGRKFWPLSPRAEDVDVRDVVRGLAMTCRYAGQVKRFYSVAEHCFLVSLHVPPQYAKLALFHDCAEAYIGDMIRPLKHQRAMKPFRDAEAEIEKAVFAALGLEMTREAHAAIKEIDNRILVDEITQLSAAPHFYFETPLLKGVVPLGEELRCMTPASAELWFRRRYQELFGERMPAA